MKRVTRQLSLPSFKFTSKFGFGGGVSKSNPKKSRPIPLKQAVHIVMRSTVAVGTRSMLKRQRRIESLVRGRAAAEGIRVYDFANVGNHLHIVIRVPSRRAYKSYVRALGGLIARQVLGAERGKPQLGQRTPGSDVISRFWDARPYTRIVTWGRDYAQLKSYVELNRMEAAGIDRATAAVWLGNNEIKPVLSG